jgi:RimJ/RimL family protein N-acetyltransferase
MKHDVTARGFGVRLRPVEMGDAAFILCLRSHPRVRGLVGDTPPTVDEQRAWIAAYFERADDYYFVVETEAGVAIGTVGIYDVKDGLGQWGRWIIAPEAQGAALPVGVVVHQVAFDQLQLTALLGSVVATNEKVLGFHRRFGAEFTHTEPRARCIGGEWVDMTWIRVQRAAWPAMLARLTPLAVVAERSLRSPAACP